MCRRTRPDLPARHPHRALTLDAWRRTRRPAGTTTAPASSAGGTARAGPSTTSTSTSADIELHTGSAPATARRARAGTTTDSGRQRWWDGRRWTDALRYSGEEQSFAGIVVDGRWIHFGASSQPVAGRGRVLRDAGRSCIKQRTPQQAGRCADALRPVGPITPRLLSGASRASRATSSWRWAVRCGSRPSPRDRMPQHAQFVTWINNVSEHYRYR